jgi:hypothetical protein
MKNTFLLLLICSSSFFAEAQRIQKVYLNDKGASMNVYFLMDENVVLSISQTGEIGEWGVDMYADRTGDFIQRQLRPYEGRVERYGAYDNEALRGKIRYIGRTQLNYYASFDEKFLVGKLKSIGPINITYYSRYDDPSNEGKVKSIGTTNIAYYTSFDNDAFKNKIKQFGTVGISYYSSMDDKAFSGKVKSFNGVPFAYFSSFDQPQFRGSLKSGNMIQVVNAVTYYIR